MCTLYQQIKHFEPIWGENCNIVNNTFPVPEKESVSPKTAAKCSTKRPPSPVLRNRTVGAVTRSVSMYREKREAEDPPGDVVKKFKPGECEMYKDFHDEEFFHARISIQLPLQMMRKLLLKQFNQR